jgi:DNA-directed RNA polymerase specialized sigma24 family protein
MKPFEFTAQQVWEHKDGLSDTHFDILQMRVECCSIVQMALEQAVPKGTVKSRLHRATKSLKELINGSMETKRP